MNCKTHSVIIPILPKVICIFSAIPIKIPSCFFEATEKLIVNLIWNAIIFNSINNIQKNNLHYLMLRLIINHNNQDSVVRTQNIKSMEK